MILKIDGVSYKFKPNATRSAQRRFVGYIAQQIESVVPEAVQLIDGVLHVDYESMIPYLSESVKQNFNDIQNLQSHAQSLESLLNQLYDQFTAGPRNQTSTKITPVPHKQRSLLGRIRWPWIAGALALAVTLGIIIGLVLANSADDQGGGLKLPLAPAPGSATNYDVQQILAGFYRAMNGEHWRIKTNWLSASTVCDWYGITCDAAQNVVAINLSNNNVSGTLQDELVMYKLPSLVDIDLSRNDIHHLLGNKFSILIKRINLAENDIQDDVSKLKQLTSLKYLNIAHNGFYGAFQFSAQQLRALKELNVSHNSINSVSPSLVEDFTFDVCDWSANYLSSCDMPDWLKKCGAGCY